MIKNKTKPTMLHTAVHTLAITGIVKADKNIKTVNGLELLREEINRETGEIVSYVKVNPNKYYYSKDEYINNLSTLRNVLREIEREYFNERITINRIDFCIDDYEHIYSEYWKLNKLIVLALATTLGLNNRWESYEPITKQGKTIRGQNKYNQVECYDRISKTGVNGLAKTRLELRNTAGNFSINDIFTLINEWIKTIRQIETVYDSLQNSLNESLIEKWQNESLSRNPLPMYDFVKKYNEEIYQTKQLKVLLAEMGAQSPETLAKIYVYRADIFTVNKRELHEYVNVLIESLRRFRGRY